jgi:hypothetical protein
VRGRAARGMHGGRLDDRHHVNDVSAAVLERADAER